MDNLKEYKKLEKILQKRKKRKQKLCDNLLQ